MQRDRHCTIILLSGGSGKRMGSSVAKQYLELKDKPILYYSLRAIQMSNIIDQCILVIRPEDEGYVRREILDYYSFSKVTKIAYAGKERYESVWKGLCAIDTPTDIIFIHDGARPFLSEAILERSLEGALKYGACVAAVPSKDTVKIINDHGMIVDTPPRKNVWNIQTPQTFAAELIIDAYTKAIESGDDTLTDDAGVVEKYSDKKVYVVQGDYTNIKVTTPEDLLAAEAYL